MSQQNRYMLLTIYKGVKLLNNASRCDSGLRLNTSTSPNVMHKSNYSSTVSYFKPILKS